MADHTIAFWNLENLFDLEDSPHRPAWLRDRLARELVGWDEAVLSRKVAQLVRVVAGLNGARGPDLLGVCEVESRPVLERLVSALAPLGRDYGIAHHDTSDQRGIDVAFLYDRARFTAQEQFSHVILKRTGTRDLFQVNFTTPDGRLLVVVGNHWPSRSGGRWESEPYRITAAETLSYWLTRILEIKGSEAAVLVMGDFNDEPSDRAMVDYALAGSSAAKVRNARSPRLLNLMWPALGAGTGSHYFDNFANVLDQFCISRGLLTGAGGFRVADGSVRVEMPAPMVSGGDYPSPIRFGRPSAGLNPDGFSDHYPISLVLQETTP